MKCETPARSSRSSREPTSIQNPSATERTLGHALRDDPLAASRARSGPPSASPDGRRTQARATKRRTVPFRFASYNASSARRNSVCASVASSGQDAHAEARAEIGRPRLSVRGQLRAAPRPGPRPARASSSVASASRSANSSPPMRKASSGLRSDSARTFAKATSASSPAGVAERSLTLLEAVEVGDHESEGAVVTHRARDLALEPRRRRRAG